MKIFEVKKVWCFPTNKFMNRWKEINTERKVKVSLGIYIFAFFSFFIGSVGKFFLMKIVFVLMATHILMFYLHKIMDDEIK